jgi:acetate kinase
MKILVLNCGSSSMRYKLFDMPSETLLAEGFADRIGKPGAHLEHRCGGVKVERTDPIDTHNQTARRIRELLTTVGEPPPLERIEDISAIGHRVVDGGERYHDPALLDDEVLDRLEDGGTMAPQHVHASLLGVRAGMRILPERPHVAVFDTAFFPLRPPEGTPQTAARDWQRRSLIRRHGFRGTSHRYAVACAADSLCKPAPTVITLHLGRDTSLACVREGVTIDAALELTPSTGGPGLVAKGEGRSDLRWVWQRACEGDEAAEVALEFIGHKVRRNLGGFLAELGGCDALVFTGHVGHRAASFRQILLERLVPLGIRIDAKRNRVESALPFPIHAAGSAVQILVVPTDEERMIARDTVQLASRAAPGA